MTSASFRHAATLLVLLITIVPNISFALSKQDAITKCMAEVISDGARDPNALPDTQEKLQAKAKNDLDSCLLIYGYMDETKQSPQNTETLSPLTVLVCVVLGGFIGWFLFLKPSNNSSYETSQREHEQKRVLALKDENNSYNRWLFEFQKGKVSFNNFVRNEFTTHGLKSIDIAIFFDTPFMSEYPFVSRKFTFELWKDIKDIDIANSYFEQFLVEEVLPKISQNPKQALDLLKQINLNEKLVGIWSQKYPLFVDLYKKYTETKESESLRTKFNKKKRLVEARKIDHHLPNHMVDLAEFYIKGVNCEKNHKFARELIDDAISISKQKMRVDNQEALLIKCNQLLRLIE